MATTSTIPAVKAQLVSLIDAALTVPVTYAWPGADTKNECVFLGPHPETADIRLDSRQNIPTIKAGRKQRQEEYAVRVTVWSFRPELSATGAQTCEARAFELAEAIENVLANDSAIGLGTTIQVASVESLTSTLFPFLKGWACELAIDIEVKARLT